MDCPSACRRPSAVGGASRLSSRPRLHTSRVFRACYGCHWLYAGCATFSGAWWKPAMESSVLNRLHLPCKPTAHISWLTPPVCWPLAFGSLCGRTVGGARPWDWRCPCFGLIFAGSGGAWTFSAGPPLHSRSKRNPLVPIASYFVHEIFSFRYGLIALASVCYFMNISKFPL